MKPVPLTTFKDHPAIVLVRDGTLLAFLGLPPEGADPIVARYAAERMGFRVSADESGSWAELTPVPCTLLAKAGMVSRRT